MASLIVNYEQTHPIYPGAASYYDKCETLYDGGEAVNRTAQRFLTQHPFEKDNQFAIRLKRAAYKNFAAPTVDLFSSSIIDGSKREGIENLSLLAPLLKDCDRQGLPPAVFFKRVVTRAAAAGARFVLVDMPRAEKEAITVGDAKRMGLIPFFADIPAGNVLDWGYDNNGALNYAVIKESHYLSPGPFQKHEEVSTITVWTKNEWQRYEAISSAGYTLTGEGSHPVGKVPLVPFLYEQSTPMTGSSVLDDVVNLLIRIFNQDSELDKMLFDAAMPLLVAYGLKENEMETFVKSTSSMWRMTLSDARLEYVEPAGSSFTAKRQQIMDDIECLREISLRQTRPKGAQAETAESKRLDSIQISSQLAEFARNAAASELQCWKFAAAWLEIGEDATEQIEVKYNQVFDPDALKEKLDALYLELFRESAISRETLLRHTLEWDEDRLKEEAALIEQAGRVGQGPSGSLASILQQQLNR